MSPSLTSELLTPTQVAEALGISEKTLANWRSARVGPPIFRTRGVVRYPKRAFEQWIKDNTEEMDGTRAKEPQVALPVLRRQAQAGGSPPAR